MRVHTCTAPWPSCLPDSETKQIEAYCERGGTVIADYLPGLWDQHGKGLGDGREFTFDWKRNELIVMSA